MYKRRREGNGDLIFEVEDGQKVLRMTITEDIRLKDAQTTSAPRLSVAASTTDNDHPSHLTTAIPLMSARGNRVPSGPWSRLKPVNLDPLEVLGLPSKGDNRY
jgi:hypothetical protein